MQLTQATLLLLTTMGPLIGSLLGILNKPSLPLLRQLLSFSAGVMIAISFFELLPQALSIAPFLFTLGGILLGILFMYGITALLPHSPLEHTEGVTQCNLKNTSLCLLIGIFFHNIPEGLAIAVGTVAYDTLGLVIALGIAIHNIPEGILTSAPYYAATGKRLKSFLYSSSTIIPLIIGFLLGKFFFLTITSQLLAFLCAMTASVMTSISINQLLPASRTEEKKQFTRKTLLAFLAGTLLVILLGLL